MLIIKTVTVNLALAGRLDAITGELLSDELNNIFSNKVDKLILDFKDIVFMNSAGLRIIVNAQKIAHSKDTQMELVGVNDSIYSIFQITGFANIIAIKN